ncbi:hypothetical protein MKX01_004368, partial [Papaver californicum]
VVSGRKNKTLKVLLPKVLILHLGQITFEGGASIKINKHVRIPPELVLLGDMVASFQLAE